ncbi:hypothetical protein COV06_00425 [Candidatus Uhrbacteria bacterium CG10_big_fil_rev_8_21_14_0_10_50_16]|uniref:Uncharacterized protein n=1 Tax=Candidatus Uhrbacteria bacterium CG10_big_fil_rev_8_21_14_0_10_50_16 TaxID=1975039 RepID=A0A2H0RPD4_9BACT|nr:MAG: hypothetical protein COV06_00425 [Candidatus Uhrbacteria bacterium CG10_big_fil_rev_8_21_14_0_10_50_16]
MSQTSKTHLLQDPTHSRFAWHDLKKNATLSKFLLDNFQNESHGSLSTVGKKILKQLRTVNEDQNLLLNSLSLLSRTSLGSFQPKSVPCHVKELLRTAQLADRYTLGKRRITLTGESQFSLDQTVAQVLFLLGIGILARACPNARLACELTKTTKTQTLGFAAHGSALPTVPKTLFTNAEKFTLKHQPWFGLAVYLASLPTIVQSLSGTVRCKGSEEQITLSFTFPL